MMNVTERMQALAGAVRSRAREHGRVLADLTNEDINDFADAQYREQPRTAAGQFYMADACGEWHWRRICAMVRRGW